MFDEQIKYTAESMAQQKDEIIRNAITQRIADEWNLSDLKKRGCWKVFPDRSEIFSLDSIDLVQFFPMESEIKTKDSKVILTVTRRYKILYKQQDKEK